VKRLRADRGGSARHGRAAAQALVEFSLVLPIFVLLLLGLVEGGRLVFANNTVSQAAREAARLAAVEAAYIPPATCTAPVCPASLADFETKVLNAANTMTVVVGSVPAADLYITCTTPATAPTGAWTGGNNCNPTVSPEPNISGNLVSIRLLVPIKPMTPIFGPFYPTTLSAASAMAIP